VLNRILDQIVTAGTIARLGQKTRERARSRQSAQLCEQLTRCLLTALRALATTREENERIA
jgi:hypothetical protein